MASHPSLPTLSSPAGPADDPTTPHYLTRSVMASICAVTNTSPSSVQQVDRCRSPLQRRAETGREVQPEDVGQLGAGDGVAVDEPVLVDNLPLATLAPPPVQYLGPAEGQAEGGQLIPLNHSGNHVARPEYLPQPPDHAEAAGSALRHLSSAIDNTDYNEEYRQVSFIVPSLLNTEA